MSDKKSTENILRLDGRTVSVVDAVRIADVLTGESPPAIIDGYEFKKLPKGKLAHGLTELKGSLHLDDYWEDPHSVCQLCVIEGKCNLHANSAQPLIMGDGPDNAQLMIVGEVPGKVEDKKGRPFVGESGQVLRSMLMEAGVDPDDCYITNVCKCMTYKHADPKVGEIKSCVPMLRREIELVKPNLVLLLGNTPLKEFHGKSGITALRGIEFVSEKYGVKCLATFHPANIVRGDKAKEPYIRRDINKAVRLMESSEITAFDEPKIYRVNTVEEVRWLKDELLAAEEVAFDLETSSLNMFDEDAHVLMISFAWAWDKAAYVVLDHPENKLEDDTWDEIVEILEEFFLSDVPKIGHNIKFDIKWLRAVLEIQVNGPLFDTMLAHYATNELIPHGLKLLSADYLNFPAYDSAIPKPKGKSGHVYFGDVALPDLGRYAGLDSCATWRLKQALQRELLEHGVDGVFRNILMPASAALIEVELRGLRIDVDYLEDLEERLDNELADLDGKLLEFDSVQRFITENAKGKQKNFKVNFKSPLQLQKILFDYEGLKPVKMTDSGKGYSTDKETLTVLSEQGSELAELLKERSHLATLQNNFVRGLHEKFLQDGDVIFPSYLLHGTVTGRLSCREPNLQQVPREDWIKKLYIGSKDENLILAADYSQMELRVVASLSGDKAMQESFHRGEDAHAATAARIYGVNLEDVDKEQRNRAKTMNFAILYGRGATSVAMDLSMTVEQAEEFIKTFFEAVPGVHDWINKTKKSARRNGYVKTAFGRIRHLPDIKSKDRGKVNEALRQAVNTPVQSAASDVTLLAVIELETLFKAEGFQSQIIGTIHDSILVDLVPDEVDIIPQIVKDTMESMEYRWLTVPLVADVEIGKTWGETEPVDFE